jgi:DNA-binding MarR family transcriptional regulator
MATFQDTREQTEQRVLVRLLSEIERNPSITQRGLAGELGIALGLMNQYLKRCVTKGWVRASQVSPRRLSYFLTPEGFREKSQMVTGYLARSLTFFRDARVECEDVLVQCEVLGWRHLAMVGEGDLADIVQLVARSTNVNVHCASGDFETYDAVIVTDVVNPQETYNSLKDRVRADRLLTLPLLHISRGE